ncbi:DUF1304 domain-containing protein [Ligilactobacillus sp. LYQ135]
MNLLTKGLVVAIMIECIFIFTIETIIPKSKTTSKIFKIPLNELDNSYVNTLIKNQGVYNLLLAPMLLMGLIYDSKLIILMILVYIILVAIYGSIISQKKIIVTQGGLPILALMTLFF